jgi:uncharacterized membrane protein YiaA
MSSCREIAVALRSHHISPFLSYWWAAAVSTETRSHKGYVLIKQLTLCLLPSSVPRRRRRQHLTATTVCDTHSHACSVVNNLFINMYRVHVYSSHLVRREMIYCRLLWHKHLFPMTLNSTYGTGHYYYHHSSERGRIILLLCDSHKLDVIIVIAILEMMTMSKGGFFPRSKILNLLQSHSHEWNLLAQVKENLNLK